MRASVWGDSQAASVPTLVGTPCWLGCSGTCGHQEGSRFWLDLFFGDPVVCALGLCASVLRGGACPGAAAKDDAGAETVLRFCIFESIYSFHTVLAGLEVQAGSGSPWPSGLDARTLC